MPREHSNTGWLSPRAALLSGLVGVAVIVIGLIGVAVVLTPAQAHDTSIICESLSLPPDLCDHTHTDTPTPTSVPPTPTSVRPPPQPTATPTPRAPTGGITATLTASPSTIAVGGWSQITGRVTSGTPIDVDIEVTGAVSRGGCRSGQRAEGAGSGYVIRINFRVQGCGSGGGGTITVYGPGRVRLTSVGLTGELPPTPIPTPPIPTPDNTPIATPTKPTPTVGPVTPPPPDKVAGLTAMPGTAHGTIVLDWDPADGADDYEVGQRRREFPDVSIWEVLDDSEVDIDLAGTSAVVRGLTGGITYRHSVRGVRGTGENRVVGPWSDDVETTALDQTPKNLRGRNMIGGRGIFLRWDPADGAPQGYVVRTSPSAPTQQISISGESAEVTGLPPDTSYSFSVRSWTQLGGSRVESPWSDTFEKPAPTPTSIGHQADHTVKYVLGTIGNSVIENAIGRAVGDWKLSMLSLGKGLLICSACDDEFTVTIKAVDNKNDATGDPNNDENEGCGGSYACMKPVSEDATPLPGVHVGPHMENMFIVFEDPPKSAAETTAGSGGFTHTVWEWTADITKAGMKVPGSKNPERYYAYIDRVMLHEFGRTLGLHDFYADTLMDHLDAVMNIDNGIRVEDIKQLEAIYLLHSSH